MRFHDQTLFGNFQSPPAERGDCDRTCLASFLECEPSEVPHFYATAESADAQRLIHEWLEARGFIRFGFAPAEGDSFYNVPFGPFIAVGKSPRGVMHAVIGEVVSREPLKWKMLHDPHPSREGIVGWPVVWEFVVRLDKWNQPTIGARS